MTKIDLDEIEASLGYLDDWKKVIAELRAAREVVEAARVASKAINKKKVKLYMPVVSDGDDRYTTIRYAPELGKRATHAVRFTPWHSDKNFFKELETSYGLKIVGWIEQEIEVEVDE